MADVRTLYSNAGTLTRTQNGDNHLVDGLKGATAPGVSINSEELTNLADPTALQSAATRAWSTRYWKFAARAATTANITLSGTQTVDGVALIAGDVCLVKNQTTGANNGPYTVASGSWTRRLDSSTSAQVPAAMMIAVSEGTINAASLWILSTAAPITLGTTALTFVNISGGTLSLKSGSVAAGSFTGNPKTASVTFSTAYPNTNYAISCIELAAVGSSHNITITSKSSTGFTINLGANNITGVTEVLWQTSKYGEQ